MKIYRHGNQFEQHMCLRQGIHSRVSGVELPAFRGLLLFLVPEAALVLRPGAQVPRLDQETLRGVDIALGVDLLDANPHAILGEDDIL